MNFFNDQVIGESETYARIRDRPEDWPIKSQIEGFWQIYKSYAPRNFKKEVQRNFHQRWREMFLSVGMINLGFNIITSRKDKGPDLRIQNISDQNIWIEAIAPRSGSKDHVIPDMRSGIHDLPESEFLLRLTSAVDSKKSKFVDYLSKGVIKEDDVCIIALSACDLKQYGSLMNTPIPALLKILAGGGSLTLTKDRSYIAPRENIIKNSGADIEVRLFEDPSFDLIAAILYSVSDPLNSPDKPEDTFQLFINPLAKSDVSRINFHGIDLWFQSVKQEDYSMWSRKI